MKSLLVVLTLAFSAQTFADCNTLPTKKSFINAEKILCDDSLGQVLLEGIKISKFGKEENVLVNGNNRYDHYVSSKNICNAFGLGSPVEVQGKKLFSYLNSGVEIGTEYDEVAQAKKFLLIQKNQTRHVYPVSSIICEK